MIGVSMSLDSETIILNGAIAELLKLVASLGISDLNEIALIVGEKTGLSPDEIIAELLANPLASEEPTFDDVMADAVRGVSVIGGASR
jgi:hypothetical protein